MTDTNASTFHALHRQPGRPLLLPNAWDAGSAAVLQNLGAQAIATSSAAVAWAQGYGDGDRLPVPRLLEVLAAIARRTRVPLSADIEGGYAEEPQAVGETVAAVIGTGTVGINIEDGRGSPDLLCRKIEAARAAADRAGVPLFINARCDVYLKSLAAPGKEVAELLRRAALYRAAGADGLFAPAAVKVEDIAAIVAGTPLPVNLMALPGLPAAGALAALGVRRISAGSALVQSVYGHLAQRGRDFLQDGDGAALAPGAMDYASIQALMG